MSRKGVPEIDLDDAKGAHAADRLRTARVGWLTSVAADGTPQSSPVWFVWNTDEIVMYSVPSPRVANVNRSTRVSLHLDGDGRGGDVVVIEGDARVDRSAPSAAGNLEYLAKYRPVMDARGWTPEWFAGRYSVPIRIRPTRYRYW